jgi:hypothetical protein
MKTNVFAPAGVCQFCNCTEAKACCLATGDSCSWMGYRRNCCNNPLCIKAWHDGLVVATITRKKTPGEISELIRRRGRGRKKVRA